MSFDPSLLGVALIVRSKDGPRFVFHYPPHLTPNHRTPRPPYGTELAACPSTANSSAETSEDELEDSEYVLNSSVSSLNLAACGNSPHGAPPDRHGPGSRRRHVRDHAHEGMDQHYELPEGESVVPWEHLDVFSTKDLASILTPSRGFHKRCFELTLDPLTFVTYPMHVREDGRWKKKKREKRRKRRDEEEIATQTPEGEKASAEEAVITESPGQVGGEGVEAEAGKKEIPKGTSFTSDDANAEGGMTMFNLVFIMNPRKSEAPARVMDMFEHVAKDINKALRYAQNYSNYVWKESDMILNMKEKAKEKKKPMSALWNSILSKSTLAQAIKSIYESISTNNIAVVQLMSDPPVRLSVQIPKPYFLSMLPEFDEPSMPGLWVTTANFLRDQDEDDTSVLSKHFALLLLEDEEKTIADIQSDGGELTAPLLEYLKIIKPTLSFHQTAQQHAISLSDIRVLAQHLIYHRRAIAIPPLHPRDTYILSPNSPNRELYTFSQLWAQKFPLAHPLPTFLAIISAAPRPYKTFIPSKAHRPVYISMLAFLLRHGWVTQLRTFAWIIAWPEIKYEVQHALDGAAIRAAHQDAIQDAIDESLAAARSSGFSVLSPVTSNTSTSSSKSTSTVTATVAVSSYPHSPPPPKVPPQIASISSEAAAEQARLRRLRDKAVQDLAEFNARPLPQRTAHPSCNNSAHLSRIQPQVILEPARAEMLDSLYLAAIAKRLDDSSASTSTNGNARHPPVSSATPSNLGTSLAHGSLKLPPSTPSKASLSPSHNPSTPGPSTPGTYITNPLNLPNMAGVTPRPVGLGAAGINAIVTTTATSQHQQQQQQQNKKYFLKWAKYFDGRTSLERIALLEGVKRKEMWALISGWEEYLLVVRHW